MALSLSVGFLLLRSNFLFSLRCCFGAIILPLLPMLPPPPPDPEPGVGMQSGLWPHCRDVKTEALRGQLKVTLVRGQAGQQPPVLLPPRQGCLLVSSWGSCHPSRARPLHRLVTEGHCTLRWEVITPGGPRAACPQVGPPWRVCTHAPHVPSDSPDG